MGWVVNATPRPIYPRERPCTHFIGCWVGPRVGLDGCGKSCPGQGSIPGPPARSELLYRLNYPDPLQQKAGRINPLRTGNTSVLTQFSNFGDDIPLCYLSSAIPYTIQTQQFITRLSQRAVSQVLISGNLNFLSSKTVIS